MKNRPIHQNLDTSFVNLSALIKYLRRRQFLGSVKIQLNGYKADIELQRDNQLIVSEHDQISGRVSTGEEALQRLLIRAREPGGTINVYQFVEDEGFKEAEEDKPIAKPIIQKPKPEVRSNNVLEAEIIEASKKFVKPETPRNGSSNNGTPKIPNFESNNTGIEINKIKETPKIEPKPPKFQQEPIKKETPLPDFPFALTNKVEERAKQNEISVEDWQKLLKLTVEMLTVIDKTLAQSKLDFTAAFRKARSEVSDDYPFLNPSAGIFDYKQGKIKMTEKINEKIFVSSIMETLRRILEKLESNPKFENVHRRISQTLIALMNKRKPHYDKFAITPHFKKILGI